MRDTIKSGSVVLFENAIRVQGPAYTDHGFLYVHAKRRVYTVALNTKSPCGYTNWGCVEPGDRMPFGNMFTATMYDESLGKCNSTATAVLAR